MHVALTSFCYICKLCHYFEGRKYGINETLVKWIMGNHKPEYRHSVAAHSFTHTGDLYCKKGKCSPHQTAAQWLKPSTAVIMSKSVVLWDLWKSQRGEKRGKDLFILGHRAIGMSQFSAQTPQILPYSTLSRGFTALSLHLHPLCCHTKHGQSTDQTRKATSSKCHNSPPNK